MNGGVDWTAQIAFLQSEAGTEYVRRLSATLKAHVAGLGA
jgi:hypothetical protein